MQGGQLLIPMFKSKGVGYKNVLLLANMSKEFFTKAEERFHCFQSKI